MKASFSTLLLSIVTLSLYGQSVTLSGYVTDASSGEALISSTVYVSELKTGTITNTYGFFSLTVDPGPTKIEFSYIGYESQFIDIDLTQSQTLNIELQSSALLEEIEITADKTIESPENVQMSQINVSVAQIKKAPMLLGEVDVIKAIQLLPGVQSGSEGFNGLYVRGGSPDQNLIILDGVPVYNISHLFGIFSVFNADAIKNVNLIKGGFPAQYGGRLSSVLDIRMKEGNLKKWEGEGSIGLISSKLTLQGPLITDKTSILLSGRRTYADVIASPFIKRANRTAQEKVDPSIYFYDFNAKIQHVFNDQHRLYLSGYFGQDRFKFDIAEAGDYSASNGLNWGNEIGALRWNWKFNDKLFANTTLTYSQYDLNVFSALDEFNISDTLSFSTKYVSSIDDLAARVDLDYIPRTDHYIKVGGGLISHEYNPGAITVNFATDEFGIDTLLGSTNQESTEYYAYLQDEMTYGKLKANVGLHFSGFAVEDAHYTSLQPRIGLRYLFNQDLSLKASYTQMSQYINLLTSESLLLPTDLWVPSTQRIKPQSSWQTGIGISATVKEDYNVTLEGYYKKMNNVLSFGEGESFLSGILGDWQDKVEQGEGESYGLELLLQKKEGRLSGWLGYTLGWNTRTFESINFGNRYPFRYDRRHDLALVLSYEISDRISLSANWVYGTGNAVTLPIQDIPYAAFRRSNGTFGFRSYQSVNEKNSFRMSDFHRMDIGISFRKKKRWGERTWVIGFYNAYAHNNPFFITLDNDQSFDPQTMLITERKVFKEISILPLLPSISYNFKFN